MKQTPKNKNSENQRENEQLTPEKTLENKINSFILHLREESLHLSGESLGEANKRIEYLEKVLRNLDLDTYNTILSRIKIPTEMKNKGEEFVDSVIFGFYYGSYIMLSAKYKEFEINEKIKEAVKKVNFFINISTNSFKTKYLPYSKKFNIDISKSVIENKTSKEDNMFATHSVFMRTFHETIHFSSFYVINSENPTSFNEFASLGVQALYGIPMPKSLSKGRDTGDIMASGLRIPYLYEKSNISSYDEYIEAYLIQPLILKYLKEGKKEEFIKDIWKTPQFFSNTSFIDAINAIQSSMDVAFMDAEQIMKKIEKKLSIISYLFNSRYDFYSEEGETSYEIIKNIYKEIKAIDTKYNKILSNYQKTYSINKGYDKFYEYLKKDKLFLEIKKMFNLDEYGEDIFTEAISGLSNMLEAYLNYRDFIKSRGALKEEEIKKLDDKFINAIKNLCKNNAEIFIDIKIILKDVIELIKDASKKRGEKIEWLNEGKSF